MRTTFPLCYITSASRPPDAINSGALLCTAPLVTLLQDNVWLPSNFVAHTLQVHTLSRAKTHISQRDRPTQHFSGHAKSLLGYVEMRFDPPATLLNR